MKLNLGSCDREFPGYTSVDICPPADIIADLARPWPWEDSSIDEIRAYDIIEHLPNKQHTMNEAWRVLRPGGRFDIDVPTTDGRGAWQDPTHVSYWNRNSFLYYTAGDAHRERFGRHYGVHARFKVVAEDHTRYPDQVVKLKIILEAVKG
jgi:SAM-dependent methyltransferase